MPEHNDTSFHSRYIGSLDFHTFPHLVNGGLYRRHSSFKERGRAAESNRDLALDSSLVPRYRYQSPKKSRPDVFELGHLGFENTDQIEEVFLVCEQDAQTGDSCSAVLE